jgi:hypothetical protein
MDKSKNKNVWIIMVTLKGTDQPTISRIDGVYATSAAAKNRVKELQDLYAAPKRKEAAALLGVSVHISKAVYSLT